MCKGRKKILIRRQLKIYPKCRGKGEVEECEAQGPYLESLRNNKNAALRRTALFLFANLVNFSIIEIEARS